MSTTGRSYMAGAADRRENMSNDRNPMDGPEPTQAEIQATLDEFEAERHRLRSGTSKANPTPVGRDNNEIEGKRRTKPSLLEQWAMADARVVELEAQLKIAKKKRDGLTDAALSYMVNHNIQSSKVSGRLLYLKREIHVSRIKHPNEVDPKDLVEERENGRVDEEALTFAEFAELCKRHNRPDYLTTAPSRISKDVREWVRLEEDARRYEAAQLSAETGQEVNIVPVDPMEVLPDWLAPLLKVSCNVKLSSRKG